MDFKEFSFSENVRVCVYNVGRESLEYHKHANVSDITYCATGRLILELPQIKRSYVFHPGQIIQVPFDTIHRVSHFSDTDSQSRYILIQIGKFSIDFVHDDHIVFCESRTDIKGERLAFYIGDQLENLKNIAMQFRKKRPPKLSDSEYADILVALDATCRHGISQRPRNDLILHQLHALD